MTYGERRLQGPEERHEVGTQDGETCGRYEEPDGCYPCQGVMEADVDAVVCIVCGALA